MAAEVVQALRGQVAAVRFEDGAARQAAAEEEAAICSEVFEALTRRRPTSRQNSLRTWPRSRLSASRPALLGRQPRRKKRRFAPRYPMRIPVGRRRPTIRQTSLRRWPTSWLYSRLALFGRQRRRKNRRFTPELSRALVRKWCPISQQTSLFSASSEAMSVD